MNTSKIIAAAFCGWFGCSAAFAAVPVVSNVTSQQRVGTKLVDITYNVADADGDTLKIRIEVSSNSGTTYNVPASSLTGAIGDNITPGTGKQIIWNAGVDWDGEYSAQMRVKVIASDAKGLPGLAWGNEVAAGGFLMGQDGGAEGSGSSRHVNIPWSFWLSKYEIRIDQYCEYLNIALAAGQVQRSGSVSVSAAGSLLLYLGDVYDIRWNVNKFEPLTGRDDKPVSVTWYGAWAFATYYGYDLPTTAEWEKGARGPNNDDEGEHLVYPWGDAIYSNTARYGSSSKATVGSYGASGYGLHDIIGNVAEWTRSSNTAIETYSQQESLSASHNQLDSSPKLLRGGGYWDYNQTLKIYYRSSDSPTTYREANGFRVIRRTTP